MHRHDHPQHISLGLTSLLTTPPVLTVMVGKLTEWTRPKFVCCSVPWEYRKWECSFMTGPKILCHRWLELRRDPASEADHISLLRSLIHSTNWHRLNFPKLPQWQTCSCITFPRCHNRRIYHNLFVDISRWQVKSTRKVVYVRRSAFESSNLTKLIFATVIKKSSRIKYVFMFNSHDISNFIHT